MKKLFSILLTMWVTTAASYAFAQTDALAQIKSEGVIKIGINPDYRPFGMRDSSGNIIGIEADLAQDISKRLKVKVELVPVQPTNRIQFLQQGRIDLILSTLTYNPERAKVVDFIEPFYYAGGTGIIGRKGSGIKKWEDLREKTVCGVQGTYYNRPLAEKYGVKIAAFADVNQAVNALQNNACIAFVEDSTLVAQMVSDPKMKEFEQLLPPDDLQPWGLAVAKGQQTTPYGKFIKEILVSWHRDGILLAAEKKWGLPESEWLRNARSQYK